MQPQQRDKNDHQSANLSQLAGKRAERDTQDVNGQIISQQTMLPTGTVEEADVP